ncbi:MAG: ImmA/IrrE family metallo-endopeptidase [Mangrovibacterium sp.]
MIKPDRIPFARIRSLADDFRKEHCSNITPVPIEEIVEFRLGIEIRPVDRMSSKTDLDAVLSNNCKIIFVDQQLLDDDRYLFRYRFALAHEVGHFVLHSNKLADVSFKDIEEWIKVRSEFDHDDLKWFEAQAMEFGGRLMVPRDLLYKNVERFEMDIRKYFDSYPDADYRTIISFISPKLNRIFEVSERVVEKRILCEKILEDLGF